jgi:hypothetical protein
MLGRWLDLQQTPAERQAVLLRYAEGLLRDTKEQEVRERG